MLYKKYGKLNKELSVIGFGGMRFRKDNGQYDIDTCSVIVTKANELGINYFDTAPFYCDSKSEEIFGRAFKNMPGQFYVSTKSSRTDPSKLRKDLETSLKRMDIPKIDFFHIWCVTSMDDYRSRMIKGGAYDAALKAKSEGLIDHIAISTHCSGEEIETIIKDGAYEGITIGYNILNFPYRQRGLKAAYDNGLGVATMNPLSGGLIPSKPEYFDFIRDRGDETVTEAALRFNASHKEITTVLSGMGSIEEVIDNVKVGNNLKIFSESKLKEIEGRLSASMDTLCTGCQYCEFCPKKIPVSKFMLSFNQSMLEDKSAALNMLKYHWEESADQAESCIECGLCESKCTQHLPIIQRLKEINSWK